VSFNSWGMSATGSERPQLVLNLELLLPKISG
jgi:hypothetical protein